MGFGLSYGSALDQRGEQVTAFVRLCSSLVGEHALVNVLNILDDGVGGDDAAMKSRSASERG